jgi:dipeptidyl aminopeptidase/acylaminoacyl peptidase
VTKFLPQLMVIAMTMMAGAATGADEPATLPAITPGDNLVVEGVPPVPVAMADEIDRYLEFRAATIADWHPARREMAVFTRFADTVQVHLVKMPAGARTQLTFFKDNLAGATFQPTTGDYLVLSKDIGGNEQYQKYRFDLTSGALTLLTDGKSRNTGGTWSNDGNLLAYGSTRRNGQDVDLRLINPADPASDRQLIELQGGGWGAEDFSPDDHTLLASEFLSATESALWLIDVASAKKSRLTPADAGKISYGGARFAKDGKGVYVTTDRDSEFQRLAYIDLATGAHTYLTSHINWDIEEFDLSHDGKTIAFIANEEGVGVLHLLDTATAKERPAPRLPLGVVAGIRFHKNNRDLGFYLSAARSPADAYSLDIDTGKIERWTFSETGGLNTETFIEPQLIRWKSFDGRSISGWLYLPPAGKFPGKRPVIVDIHGGPEGQARPSFQASNNYYLNELGVAFVFPNIRGSVGYGKTFITLDDGFKREDSYKDLNALFDHIATRSDLDASRIMVRGGSYGGHATLAIATWYPDRIRCALDVVGMSSLVTFLENTSPYRRDLRRVEYGDERDPAMREFLNRIAPLNHTDKITKPLFVVQGANDPRVPLSEATQMVAAVRKIGTPVWYLMAKDEGHGFAKKKNQRFQVYSSVLFTREYLLK